jgi:SAM-dependent methyltransferase
MTEDSAIISLTQWFQAPAGRYLLDWEQRHLDQVVADLFGFHALQLGMTELEGLRANRMPHRWVALDAHGVEVPRPVVEGDPAAEVPADVTADVSTGRVAVVLRCDFDALPFDSQSLDLVVLPHTLELARDPHLALGEVERVLRPEGRVVILGFNPTSLWGLRQRCGRLLRYIGFSRQKPLFLPNDGEFLGYWRLRDWLRLLSFEVQGGRFGCYRPPLKTDAWLARYAWTERIGERWWPVLGSVYLLVAVKRVRGMRLVGLIRQQRTAGQRAATVASHRAHSSSETP